MGVDFHFGLAQRFARIVTRIETQRNEIFGALRQLGLKLETEEAPVDIFVIDHIEKPDAN